MSSSAGTTVISMGNPMSNGAVVGRRTELSVLEEHLHALTDERTGGMLLISGEAGVGKSRLIEALIDMAHSRGTNVLLGRCIHLGETLLPVAPVVDFMAELDRQLDSETFDEIVGPAKSEMAGYLPSRTPRPASQKPLEAPRLIELVNGILIRLSDRKPLVVVVEDLHWADRTTRDLVGFLALALRQQPVLLVVTYRSDDLHRRHPLLPVLANLQRSARPERIDLEPFDTETTAAFLESLVGGEVDRHAVADLQRRSGGNAFYLEELQGSLAPGTPVPMTLRDVVLSRSLDLDDDALGLLRVASVAGAHLDVQLLQTVTGFDRTTMNVALHNLVDAYFLVEQDDRFRFRHELTREVFIDELLPGERSDLHAALAEALQRTEPSRIGLIAHHWHETVNRPEALSTAVQAGMTINQTGASAEALLHFERAIELWDVVPSDQREVGLDHAQLLLEAAAAAFQAHDFKLCIDLARQGCAELEDAEPLVRALAQADLLN
ncbi:MAG: ATP-binding protein, partial [Acidimicrobiales bacterium]